MKWCGNVYATNRHTLFLIGVKHSGMLSQACTLFIVISRDDSELWIMQQRNFEENIWTKEGWSDGRVEKTA
jgi:hypothetical protein